MKHRVTEETAANCHFFLTARAPAFIYPLSLHDALPIFTQPARRGPVRDIANRNGGGCAESDDDKRDARSEEHTSELQSQSNLVCRLLLEKKKLPSRLPAKTCATIINYTTTIG